MFKTLREVIQNLREPKGPPELDPKKPPKPPFDLTHAELAAVKEIRGHPQWRQYLRLLDKLTTFLAEDMLAASQPDTVLFYRNYILGIRRAGTIVDEIIEVEKAKDARRTEPKRDLDRLVRETAATFGTPYFYRS